MAFELQCTAARSRFRSTFRKRGNMQELSHRPVVKLTTFDPTGAVMQKIAEDKGCGTKGGSGKASCGSGAGQNDLAPEIWEKVKNNPCYSEEAHNHYARMHVAVAPACNI